MKELSKHDPEQALSDRVAPDRYHEALLVWLDGKKPNTRRSYRRALQDFQEFTASRTPDGAPIHFAVVQPAHVAAWKRQMVNAGKSDRTVAQRLSALSAFYRHLVQHDIHRRNPVTEVPRDDLELSPYGSAKMISTDDFRAILAEIDTTTINGARDYAMLHFYYLLFRRRSEVTNLYGRDIRLTADGAFVHVRQKGGQVDWWKIPPPLWQAIARYLALDGRQLVDDEPLFQATTDAALNLPHVMQARERDAAEEGTEIQAPRPLSGDAINQALKRYAYAAGLDGEELSIHSLRHLATVQHYKKKRDLKAVQRLLGHASPTTTDLYLQALEVKENDAWREMLDDVQ